MPITEHLSEIPGVLLSTRYSYAVTVTGRLAFLAGQVAVDPAGDLVGPGDLGAQTEQALRNLHAVIRQLGADWADVVRFNWYLTDVSRIDEMRAARDRVIGPVGAMPASTLLQVAGLFAPGYLIEVDAVVALPD
jgi:enamine deaminase RidA (YjgF/YER057c/UK114 family)